MAKYSLDTLTSVFLTKNIRKQQDNLPESRRTLVPHADAISLYQAIKDILEYLQITSTGVTNLGVTQTTTTVTVTSSSGDDGTIPSATTLLAGAMSADDKTNLQALITLSGLTAGSTNFGTFTGTIIDDNSTLKNILQQLELAIAASVAGGIYGGSGTIAPNAVATLTPNSVFQIEFDGGGTALHISDLNEIVTISSPDGFYSLGTTPTQLLLTGPSGDLSFNATNTVYTDTLSGQGIQYAADYSATYTDRTLVDKEYVDNAVLSPLPAGTSTGQIIYWNGSAWVLTKQATNVQTNLSDPIVYLPHSPNPGLPLDVYLNGVLKQNTEDYTTSGNEIVFSIPIVLSDKVTTKYYYS